MCGGAQRNAAHSTIPVHAICHPSLLGHLAHLFYHLLSPTWPTCQVQNSTRRTWLRLVGLRHDVQLWDAEQRTPQPLHPRPYASTYDPQHLPSLASAQGEAWIAAVLEPYRRQYLQECELFLPEWDHSDQAFACLSGVLLNKGGGALRAGGAVTIAADGGGDGGGVAGRERGRSRGPSVMRSSVQGGAGGAAAVAAPPPSVLKEVVVFRDPPVVHVYDVVSHGRRFYRTLVASSDNAFCLHDMPCTLFLQGMSRPASPWSQMLARLTAAW